MKRIVGAFALPALVTGAFVACGNVYADPVEVPYNFGSLGFDAGTIPVTQPEPIACPSQIRENAPCDDVGIACELGESSDPDCNAIFTCLRDSSYGPYWSETRSPRCAGVCPAPAQIVDGAPCTVTAAPDSGIPANALELQCEGPESLCACTTGPDGASVHERRWVCVPAGLGCPVSRPNLGRPCLGDGKCDYGSCAFKRGTGMTCEGGVWQVEATPCP